MINVLSATATGEEGPEIRNSHERDRTLVKGIPSRK